MIKITPLNKSPLLHRTLYFLGVFMLILGIIQSCSVLSQLFSFLNPEINSSISGLKIILFMLAIVIAVLSFLFSWSALFGKKIVALQMTTFLIFIGVIFLLLRYFPFHFAFLENLPSLAEALIGLFLVFTLIYGIILLFRFQTMINDKLAHLLEEKQ